MGSIVGVNIKDNVTNPQRLLLVDGLITNIANGDLGNANTSYTYIPWGSQGFTMGSMFLTIQNTTITVEATNDPTSVSDANATWVDVTNIIFGVASFTATTELLIDAPLVLARLRLKRLTTNATNAFACRLTRSN